MSLSPANLEDGASPELGMAQVRVNLNSRFLSSGLELPKDCMEVYARVRPLLSEEKDKGFKECIGVIDDETVRAVFPASSNKSKSNRTSQEITEDFKFTTAFGPEINQFSFFEETMMPTMVNFVEGRNSLVFSYGITGSGKTYTLQGDADNPGIIPISLKLFFSAIENQILEEPIVKPDNFSDALLLTQHEKNKEMLLKEQILKSHKVKDMSLFSNSSDPKKSFAMILCELFSDKFELPERETTLPPEEMIAAQSACQMKDISKKSAAQMEGRCCVWVSFVEIYNENVYDLLQAPLKNLRRTGLSIAEDSGDVFIKGVQQVFVSNSDEALQLLMLGRRNLKIASTRLNYESSRSHCIYSLKVVRIPSEKDIPYANVNWLSFCDLAGSERSGKAETHGIRLKEASCINTSLLVLGRCLELLRSNQTARDKKVIPFRESKLTRLLSNFLLGKGKAVMISNVSPSEYTFDETYHVLRYSAIAQQIHVNDKFLSSTSSTLQSISDQWAQSKQNVSDISCNASGLDDSYEDLIQEKDAFISQLLAVAENLTEKLKKEKEEAADMEYTIRQKVLREYAESSDQYLKKQQETHEEEKRAIRKGHAERIAAMERRYNALLKGYEEGDESHESMEVSEDNIDTYDEVSPEVESQSNALLPMPEKHQNQGKLEDLQDKNMTMSENSLKRKLAKRAEFQKFVLENEDLSKVCSPNTPMLGKGKVDSNIIDKLEQQIASLTSDLQKTKDELETNQANSVNLEKEISQCNEIISSLKAENLELSAFKMKQISDNEKVVEAKRFIQEELTKTLKELNERESENLKLKEELATAVKYKSKAYTLSEKYEYLKKEKSNLQDKCFAVSEELGITKEELADLESKLAAAKSLCDDYKTKYITLKESKVITDEKQISHLSSDLDDTREELNLEKLKSKELAETITKQNYDFTTLQEMYLSKEKELEALEEVRKALDENVSTLKHKSDATSNNLRDESSIHENCQQKLDILQKRCESKETEIFVLQENIAETISALDSLNEDIKEANDSLTECEVDVILAKERKSTRSKESFGSNELSCAMIENLSKMKLHVKNLKQGALSFKEKIGLKDIETSKLEKSLALGKEELETLKAKVLDAIKKRNCDFAALEEKYLSREKELEALEELKKSQDENVSTLKHKLGHIKESLNSEKIKSKELLDTIEKQSCDFDTLHEKYMSQEKELNEFKEVKKALDENVSTMKDKLDHIRESLQSEKSKSKELSEAYEKQHCDFTALKEKYSAKEKELETLKEITKALEENVSIFKEKLDAIKGSLISEKIISKELADAIEKQNCDFATLQEKYLSKVKELEVLEEVKRTLEENVSTLKDKLDNITESLNSEKTRSKELSEAIEKQNCDFTTLQQKYFSQEKDLQTLEELKKALNEKISSQKDQSDTTAADSHLILILERCELRSTERYEALLQQCSQERAKSNELQEKLDKAEEENQKEQDNLYHLIEALEKCECAAYCSQKKLCMDSRMYKEQISQLKRNAKCQENATEDLEKALCNVQEQLRDLHKSSQEKLDDQELEIKTLRHKNDILVEENEKMKQNIEQLKNRILELHKAEEENKQLKSKVVRHEVQKEPENTKRVSKERGNRAYSVESNNGKLEGVKQKPKKTSVRKKESSEGKEIESSRVSSLRSRENKISYIEEHLGDSDAEEFEPQKKRVQKKGTYGASLQDKRRILENSENVSPVRKFANYVGSTLKAAGTNVVKSMPSPRLTRGKKKLFNTDAH